jgi:hypothetical protein
MTSGRTTKVVACSGWRRQRPSCSILTGKARGVTGRAKGAKEKAERSTKSDDQDQKVSVGAPTHGVVCASLGEFSLPPTAAICCRSNSGDSLRRSKRTRTRQSLGGFSSTLDQDQDGQTKLWRSRYPVLWPSGGVDNLAFGTVWT